MQNTREFLENLLRITNEGLAALDTERDHLLEDKAYVEHLIKFWDASVIKEKEKSPTMVGVVQVIEPGLKRIKNPGKITALWIYKCIYLKC